MFSRKQNRAWKVRHPTMHAQREATNFSVHGLVHTARTPIDGIAFSPQQCLDDPDRRVYYTALTGLNIYSISSKVSKNTFHAKTKVRTEIKYGNKSKDWLTQL